MLCSLDDIHGRTQYDNQVHNSEQEQCDLLLTGTQSPYQQVRFTDILDEFEDTEYTKQPQNPDNYKVLTSGQEHAEIGRYDRQKVNDPKETGGVPDRAPDRDQAQEIFDREQDREHPFKRMEQVAMGYIYSIDTIKHHNNDAQHDTDDQRLIEKFAGRRVRFKYYRIYPVSQAVARSGPGCIVFRCIPILPIVHSHALTGTMHSRHMPHISVFVPHIPCDHGVSTSWTGFPNLPFWQGSLNLFLSSQGRYFR